MKLPAFKLSQKEREKVNKWYGKLKKSGRFNNEDDIQGSGIIHYEYHVTGDNVQIRVREGVTGEVLFLKNDDPLAPTMFGLQRTEQQRFEEWYYNIVQQYDFEGNPPQLVFEFTPNGIGDSVLIREKISREEIDVTDSSNW